MLERSQHGQPQRIRASESSPTTRIWARTALVWPVWKTTSGEYTFFLDGDDALKPDMCEQLAAEIDKHPVDVLHYGLTVVAANELLENERQAFETFNNTPTPDSTGEDIVRDIFV